MPHVLVVSVDCGLDLIARLVKQSDVPCKLSAVPRKPMDSARVRAATLAASLDASGCQSSCLHMLSALYHHTSGIGVIPFRLT